MNGGEGSAEELMWLLEERRRRAGDIEEQLSSEKNPEVARGLKGMLAMLKDEIAEYEHRLDEMDDAGTDYDAEIADIDSKLRDIASQMELETDPVIRNNLEVSKRFLQMERNHLLIEKTQGAPKKDPMEERLEELTKRIEANTKYIADLERRLEKAEKDASYYKRLAENPDREVSCDTTRVTVTAEALSELRNDAKMKAIENGNLKMENRELKNQIDMLRRNVRELTEHCREADSQIIKQQATLALLRKQLEDREEKKGGQ